MADDATAAQESLVTRISSLATASVVHASRMRAACPIRLFSSFIRYLSRQSPVWCQQQRATSCGLTPKLSRGIDGAKRRQGRRLECLVGHYYVADVADAWGMLCSLRFASALSFFCFFMPHISHSPMAVVMKKVKKPKKRSTMARVSAFASA